MSEDKFLIRVTDIIGQEFESGMTEINLFDIRI